MSTGSGSTPPPPPVDVDAHLRKFAATFMPLVHLDDHPEEDRYGLRFLVSLPAAIEDFVQERRALCSPIAIGTPQCLLLARPQHTDAPSGTIGTAIA